MRNLPTKGAATLLISALLFVCSCARYVEYRGYAQGGTWCVKADISGATAGRGEIGRAIEDILTEVDTTFSGYNRNSILSRRNAGLHPAESDIFRELLSVADSFNIRSGGAFDVYSAPLYDVWGFGFKNGEMPSQEAVDSAMTESRGKTSLNFNAIAQGYTCDLIARYLHSVGISNMLVDVGEIFCEGLNASGHPWSIGIDTPEDGNFSPGAKLSGIWTGNGEPCGIVTSGNYRKFYVHDGRKYAHTIDPRTGSPVGHGLLSATVVAPTATEADALATWYMVEGFEKARELILSSPGIEACLITADSVWVSPGFNGGR